MINKSLNYMLKLTSSYCLKCRRNTKSKNPEIARQKSGRIILLSKFVVYNSKKSKFLKEQEARGLLSKLKGSKNTSSKWFSHTKYFILKV